jgi:hypothetical protein
MTHYLSQPITTLESIIAIKKCLSNSPERGKGESRMSKAIIGKSVIVRANIAGVHAGKVEFFDAKTQTITLTGARRLWRIYTRDKTGSISDVAANGLDPEKQHQLGAELPRVTIVNPNGLEIAEMTKAAAKSVAEWK